MYMKFCASCSMPLEKLEFIALHKGNDDFCIYCVDDNKEVKSCDVIFEGGVQYFISEENYPREYAEKVVRKNMTMLPYWKNNPYPCLKGDMLTDEEFKKLFCEEK